MVTAQEFITGFGLDIYGAKVDNVTSRLTGLFPLNTYLRVPAHPRNYPIGYRYPSNKLPGYGSPSEHIKYHFDYSV